MFCNGVDDKAGVARPLPGYSSDLSEAWEVVDAIRRRALLSAFLAALGADSIFALGSEDAARAICVAALHVMNDAI